MERPSYLLEIPAEEYHAATKRLEYLSSHRLNLFRRCPALYIKHANGEIVEDDTAAFVLGRATHTRIIEGEAAFAREYIVADGPVNEKTGKPYGKGTEKYRAWLAEQKKGVVSTEDYALIEKMGRAVMGHDKAQQLFALGFAEGVVRGEWDGVPTQIRMDWYNPVENYIVDLKTCQDVDRFMYDIRDYGYAFQLAYYEHEVTAARKRAGVHDGVPTKCYLVAVEKKEPYRVVVVKMLPGTIYGANEVDSEKTGASNKSMIAELKRCRAEGVWPTRYEGFVKY